VSALRRAYGFLLRVPVLGRVARLPVHALREAVAPDQQLMTERHRAAETSLAALAAQVDAIATRLAALEVAQRAAEARLREVATGVDVLAEAAGALRDAVERGRPGSP
jgi:hypothetical protein